MRGRTFLNASKRFQGANPTYEVVAASNTVLSDDDIINPTTAFSTEDSPTVYLPRHIVRSFSEMIDPPN